MHHVREHVFVTDELLERLRVRGPKAPGRDFLPNVTIAGRVVHLNGTAMFCRNLTIVADEIEGQSASDPTANLRATAPDRRDDEFGVVGLRGPNVTVAARSFRAGAGLFTSGGKGGRGRNGRPGGQTPDPHWDGDPPPPMIPLPGNPGQPGAQGGASGQLTVEHVGGPPDPADWTVTGGAGGFAGEGGAGDPEGAGGGPSEAGALTPPVYVHVGDRDFVARQIAGFVTVQVNGQEPSFTQHLERAALDRFRRGDVLAFAHDLARYDAVFNPGPGGAAPVSSLSPAVERARVRRLDNRDHLGLARDLDVDPDLTRHAGPRAAVADSIRGTALLPVAAGVFVDMNDAGIRLRAELAAVYLESNRRQSPGGPIVAAGDLERQAGDMEVVRQRADTLSVQAAVHVDEVLMPWLVPAAKAAGTVTLAGGPTVDAAALAEALATLPERGVALPALPSLLVTPAQVALGPYSSFDPALGQMLLDARDIRHLAEWAPAAALPAQGLHLVRIGEQLRTATCPDQAVLAGLRELADLVRQQVRGVLRARQAAAAVSERHELAVDADAVANQLRARAGNPGVATADVALSLLDALRVAGDVLGWDATLDDRALTLRTGDLFRDNDVWLHWALFSSHDHVLDWYEAPWADAGPAAPTPDPTDAAIVHAQFRASGTDNAVQAFVDATNDALRAEHAARGQLLRPDNSRLTITRLFHGADGADVVERFRDTGSCWFELPIDSLPKAADGTPRYHEVVAAGISVRLVGARRLFTHNLEVRHSGLGRLRLAGDGRVVEQTTSPETVSIEMRAEATSTFGIAPTPETPTFTLSGRAIAAPWSLRLPDGGADLSQLTAIEVQIDLEAFVPDGASTLRRISSPDADDITVGSTAVGLIELTGPAPTGGLIVEFTSTHPEIAQPFNAVVPAGKTTAPFNIGIHGATGTNHVVVTGRTFDGASARVVLEIPEPEDPDIERVEVPGALPLLDVATLGERTFVLAKPLPRSGGGRTAGPSPTAAVEREVGAAAAPEDPMSLIAYDAALQPVGQVPVGLRSWVVVPDVARNRLFVVNRGIVVDGIVQGCGVTMHDATTLAELAEWQVGAGIARAALDPVTRLLYVSHWIGRRIFILDPDDLTLVGDVGGGTLTGPLGMAVDPALGRIYVARTFRSAEPVVEALSVIDRRPDGSHAVGTTVPLGAVVQPWHVAVDPTLELIYVLGIGGGGTPPQLIVLDRRTLAERHRINVLGFPQGISTREGTGIVHVACSAGVLVVDARTPVHIGLIPAAHAHAVTARSADEVVGASRAGEIVRARAPRQTTRTDWR